MVCVATRDTRAQRYHIILSKANNILYIKVASSVHTVRSTLPRQRSAACFASERVQVRLCRGLRRRRRHPLEPVHPPRRQGDPTTTRNSPRSFSRLKDPGNELSHLVNVKSDCFVTWIIGAEWGNPSACFRETCLLFFCGDKSPLYIRAAARQLIAINLTACESVGLKLVCEYYYVLKLIARGE